MSIQLIIEGTHMTNVLSEIATLYKAMHPTPFETTEQVTDRVTIIAEDQEKAHSDLTNEPVVAEFKPPKETDVAIDLSGKKPLAKVSRKDQEKRVKEIIAAGEVSLDEIQLFSKKNQKLIIDGMAAKATPDVPITHDAVTPTGDLFGYEPEVTEVDRDMIRDKMLSLGKDGDGKPRQDVLLKVRECLQKHSPKGEDVKVGNIPDDKLAALLADLTLLED